MTYIIVFLAILFYDATCSHDSDSSEANRIEISPLYDTIIFSDVADIISEFENNMKNPLEALIESGSESDENIDDLLAEYQHYLDKAHKQRLNYLEKTKTKNKVPLIRHERFSKTKSGMGLKYDEGYFTKSYYQPNKIAQSSALNNPLDIFLPMTQKLRIFNKQDLVTPSPSKINRDELRENRLIGTVPKIRHDTKHPCYCKSGVQCDCKCKQCFVAVESMPQSFLPNSRMLLSDADSRSVLLDPEIYTEDKRDDNTLNIRIKVDIQLPKTPEFSSKILKNIDDMNSRETPLTTVNLPLPYFNFPIPMDVFGYKKPQRYSKHDSPLHKISSAHKKKKSRQNSSSKKHRKKVITVHNLSIEPDHIMKSQLNTSDKFNFTNDNDIFAITQRPSRLTELSTNFSTVSPTTSAVNFELPNKTAAPATANQTHTEDSIFLMVNISNINDNVTEESRKIENSVEGEYPKTELNVVTEKLTLRNKREVGKILISSTTNPTDAPTTNPTSVQSTLNINDKAKDKIWQYFDPGTGGKNTNLDKELVVPNRLKILEKLNPIASEAVTFPKKREVTIEKIKISNTTQSTVKSTNTSNIQKNQTTDLHATTNSSEKTNAKTLKNIDPGTVDKSSSLDTELLYWPNNVKILHTLKPMNITTVILDRETKKAKLNMTKETMRNNRTKVLERAIFGDVNWDDVDTVAPVFLSFVGKYIRGALTFCSQNVCHSMKCAEKTCIHRTCEPNDRWNQRGHCSGSNSTDSVASLESIMDLPSNIAFEIVDILQDKMLGKLFGKVTLCISSKCITFLASKKNFLKSKCSNKDLNKIGHCTNIKNFKIM